MMKNKKQTKTAEPTYTVRLTRDQLVQLHKMARRDFIRAENYRGEKSKIWEAMHGAGNLAPESVCRFAIEDASLVNLLLAHVKEHAPKAGYDKPVKTRFQNATSPKQ